MPASKQDVLYALLALDAYNRHAVDEQRKMSDEGKNEFSGQIGNATFKESSDRMENDDVEAMSGSQLSGFSASHYTIDTQKLISYRGTDFNFSSVAGALEFLKDFGTGWLTSINVLSPDSSDTPLPDQLTPEYQPYFARQFYELVTNAKIFPTLAEGEQPSNTIITGHSLGGGLAGYIGALTENKQRHVL